MSDECGADRSCRCELFRHGGKRRERRRDICIIAAGRRDTSRNYSGEINLTTRQFPDADGESGSIYISGGDAGWDSLAAGACCVGVFGSMDDPRGKHGTFVQCTDATSARAAAAAGIVLLIWFALPSVLRSTLTAVPAGWISPGVKGTALGLCNLMELVSPWIQLDGLLNRWEEATVLGGQFWSSLLVAGLCFAVSTLRLTAWTKPTEDGVSGEVDRGIRRRWPVSRCWRLPLVWRDFHFFAGGRSFFAARWIGWLLVYGLFVGVQWMELGRWQATFSGEYGWQFVLLLVGTLSIECLLLATGSLHSEVRQMTQSSLAMLPFRPSRIFLEKAAGCGLSVLPTASWIGVAALLTGERLWVYLEWDAVLAWLLMLMFSTHVAALTSLYTRWAALPITLMVSFVAFFVIAGPMLLIPSTVGMLTRTHNIESSLLLAWGITVFWTWVLLVLPLQLWIRERWLTVVRT